MMELGLRLLFLTHHYRTVRQRGGLRSAQIARRFASSGHEVTVIAPSVDPLTEARHPGMRWWKFSATERAGPIEVRYVNCLGNRRASKLSRAFYFVSSSLMQFIGGVTRRRISIVMSTSLPSTLMVAAWLISRLRNVPLVVDVRDLSIDCAIEVGYMKNNILTRSLMKLESFVLVRADLVVATSEGLLERLRTKGVDASRLHYVPIGFDAEAFDRDSPEEEVDILAKYGLPRRSMALYAGTLSHLVDIPTMLEAARLTRHRRDILWVIAGGGERLRTYREVIDAQGLNAVAIGEVPRTDVVRLCRRATVCLYPLGANPIFGVFFGNKVFDYLGSGCPLVYSGPPGDISRMLQKSGAGVHVNPEDPQALANAVVELIDGPGGQAMGAAGREYIERHFLTEKCMAELENLVVRIGRKH